jgi:hypothetical protein
MTLEQSTTQSIKPVTWIDQIARVTLLFWRDPATSWAGVLALILSSAFFYSFAIITVRPTDHFTERVLAGGLQSILFLIFATVAGVTSLCLGKLFGSPGQVARRLTRLLVMVWIVSLSLFAISNWLMSQPWWDLFPKFITALISCGLATLLLAINTLLRRQSEDEGLSPAKVSALVVLIGVPLALIEAILFRRVVLLEPFGDTMQTLLRLLHLI